MKATNLLIPLCFGFIGGVAGFWFVSSFMTSTQPELPMPLVCTKDSTTVVETSAAVLSGRVDLCEAAQKTLPGVVHVKTFDMGQEYVGNPFMNYIFGGQMKMREVPTVTGYGSGVIISENGYIVTNNHVIKGADKVVVILNDKKEYEATVIGQDATTDVALLKIDEQGLPYVEYGNSDDVMLGEWVLAVGNPYNLTSTVTAGIISAKARDLGMNSSQMSLESFLQTDAAVNPGNSGGALVNARGQLIGINTLIQSPTGAYSGYAFAIPINIVRKIVNDFQKYGKVQKAVLGVKIEEMSPTLAQKIGSREITGIYIGYVFKDGAADNAGLTVGDIIQFINGKSVKTTPEFYEQIGKCNPGETIRLQYNRNGVVRESEVTLLNNMGTTTLSTSSEDNILGAVFESLSKDEIRQYRINVGVKITDIQQGKFKLAGMEEGYIVVKINKTVVKTPDDVINAINAITDGNVFVTAISPEGRVEYFAFALD